MKIVDNTDEYFVVSTNISFDDEILNIVKQWIPYIEILKPIELQYAHLYIKVPNATCDLKVA